MRTLAPLIFTITGPLVEFGSLIRLTTDLGVIEAELYADKAPATVANFVKYMDTVSLEPATPRNF